MTKRQRIYNKFGGLCAYTGKPLGDDWQIDHVHPKSLVWSDVGADVNSEDNLVPAIKIINHYKRSLDLEGFRTFMMGFHKRLCRVPKNPICERRIKYRQYMLKVAELFDITEDKPFCGKFYFETLTPPKP
jgi:hypothetical protein